jgi:hypothetical protein
VPGRVLRAGDKRGHHPCRLPHQRGDVPARAALGLLPRAPVQPVPYQWQALASHSAEQARTTSSGTDWLPSPPGTPARISSQPSGAHPAPG